MTVTPALRRPGTQHLRGVMATIRMRRHYSAHWDPASIPASPGKGSSVRCNDRATGIVRHGLARGVCDQGYSGGRRFGAWRNRQRGVVAIEFALMFLFGLLPLMLLVFSGALTFATKQSLTLAATDGARAALRYPVTGAGSARPAEAFNVAANRMHWLLASTGVKAAAAITAASVACPANASIQCITVTTTTQAMCQPDAGGAKPALCYWLLGTLQSTATVQLPSG